MSTELKDAGFTLARGVVDGQSRAELIGSIESELVASRRHPSGEPFAARGLLWKVQEMGTLLESCGLTELASQFLNGHAFPIDATYFDKHARANWTVPGHQDRMLPVSADSRGIRRIRGGIAYGEPSAETLAELLALRLHFDSTDRDTGALSVVPASHLGGILNTEQVVRTSIDRYTHCPAEPGDVLAMRPLLLHRSSPSKGEGQRRVLHVVYASGDPSCGIRWRRSAQQGVAAGGLVGRFAPSGARSLTAVRWADPYFLVLAVSTLTSNPMQRARLLVVTIGVLLPYIARIPGTFVHGASWLSSYFSGGMGGVLFVGAFNALSWGCLVLLSLLVRRPVALVAPALAGFGFLAFAHGGLDLGADAQSAVALAFIPVYAVPIIGVTFLLSLAVFGRGSGRAAPNSNEKAAESVTDAFAETGAPRDEGNGRFACFACGGRVSFGVSHCQTCEQPFRYHPQ